MSDRIVSVEPIIVDVNRTTEEPLTADSHTVETRTPIDLRLRGYDTPAHVHCRLDGELAQITTLEHSNYYVAPGEETTLTIPVDNIDDPIHGRIELSTGFGAESLSITVTVIPDQSTIDVDDSLATPPDRTEQAASTSDSSGTDSSSFDHGTIGIAILAAIAIFLGTITAAITEGMVAVVGVGIVAVGIVIAVMLLHRE